jgi:hypothetical protein
LYAYSNGESLRKSIRTKPDGQKHQVCLILYELLVDQLVALANDAGFTPTGRFMSLTTSLQLLPSRGSAVALRHQVGIVAQELHVIFSYGGGPAVRRRNAPCIVALATALYTQGGTALEKVEALFTWTAHKARYPRPDSDKEEQLRKARAQAILEWAGFGKGRELSQRHEHALVMELLRHPVVTGFQRREYWDEQKAAVRAMAWTLWELMNEEGIEIVGQAASYWEERL